MSDLNIKGEIWAIKDNILDVIIEVSELRAAGIAMPPRRPATTSEGNKAPAGIAVFPIFGIISSRSSWLTELFGGTNLQNFRVAFRNALRDPDIGGIILDIDSPGGAVHGLEEMATEIFAATGGNKRIVAIADAQAASAAYWLGSQADEFVVTPSGEVGSIGVLSVHEDISKALDQKGIKTSYIRAGKYKAEAVPEEPLGDEARGYIQSRVNEYYSAFVKAVARGRNVNVSEVRQGFGEGRVVGSREAVSLGMADSVGTLDEVISRLRARVRTPTVQAEKPWAHRAGRLSALPDDETTAEIRRRRARYA